MRKLESEKKCGFSNSVRPYKDLHLDLVACYTAALCSLFIAWENMSMDPIFVAVSQDAILKATQCEKLLTYGTY